MGVRIPFRHASEEAEIKEKVSEEKKKNSQRALKQLVEHGLNVAISKGLEADSEFTFDDQQHKNRDLHSIRSFARKKFINTEEKLKEADSPT